MQRITGTKRIIKHKGSGKDTGGPDGSTGESRVSLVLGLRVAPYMHRVELRDGFL